MITNVLPPFLWFTVYIMECSNHITRYIKDLCRKRNIEYTFENILNDGEMLKAIFSVNKRDVSYSL